MNKLTLEKNDYLFIGRNQVYTDGKEEKRLKTSQKIFGISRSLLLAGLIALFVLVPYTFAITLSNLRTGVSYFSMTMVIYLYGMLSFFIVGCVCFAKGSRSKYNSSTYFRVGGVCTTRYLAIGAIGTFLALWRTVDFAGESCVPLTGRIIFGVFLSLVALLYIASLALCAWNKYLLYRLTPEDYIEYEKSKI